MDGRPGAAYSFATSRPVAILVVFLAAVVFGGLSLTRLPLTLMPELTYPTLTVRTEYPGAAPEEVENDVSRPIEEELGVIGGLQRIHSVSRAGVSDVVLEFTWDADMQDATQEVLERLDRVFLPDETERPLVLHYDPQLDPILELSMIGDGPRFEGEAGLRRLRRIAEYEVKRRLEPVNGVAAARVRGGLEEEIQVLLQEEQLRRSGISIQDVIDRLGEENINLAGGTLKEGRTEYLVRTLNEYATIDEIGETVVTMVGEREIRVRDLGRVVRAQKDREIVTRTDGAESVQIEIFKEGDANVVQLAQDIRAMLGETDAELLRASVTPVEVGERDETPTPAGLAPELYASEGVLLKVVADRSVFIRESLDEVRSTALLGGVLAIFVLYVFLRRTMPTLIVALSIPISLLIAFAPMHLLGVSLNIMSLGGLAMGIGMLVDSSIVVLESIFRCREEGDDHVTAAVRGTSEVRGAVFASTLTSIAVFAPMVFVEGIAGQAFGDLGLAVVVSLLASVAVALYFIPMLASRGWGEARSDGAGGGGRRLGELARGLLRFAAPAAFLHSWRALPNWSRWVVLPVLYLVLRLVFGLTAELVGKILLALFLVVAAVLVYGLGALGRFVVGPLLWLPVRGLRWVLDVSQRSYPGILRRTLRVPGLVALALLGCLWGTWEMVGRLGSELLPEVHQGEFTVEVALPVGTPLEATDAILSPVERAILEESNRVRSLLLTLGFDSATSQRSDEGEHTARFKVLLDEGSRNAEAEERMIARLRQRFATIPDLDVRVVRPVLFSSKTPIEVEIRGDRLTDLRRIGDQARERMAGVAGLTDVEATLRAGAPEVQIVYDRDRLARYGLDLGAVARLVRDKVKGFEASRFNLKDRRIPIVVRLALEDRETVAEVRDIDVNPGGERPIPLSAIADVTLGEGPSEIRRVDSQRVAVIQANIVSGSLSGAVERIDETLRGGIEWPQGMTFEISGQNQEWQRSRTSLWLALGLSVFLVYVIMAAQFESLLHPFVIMLSIPMAFVGSLAALHVLGMTLSVVVFLGMIMLAGIVVNNAIVLVDYINRLRARGLDRTEAIVTAGTVRLRPILMTTATTVLGLLPMALGLGEGAELRTPMAVTVITGLISSTVLTLILIPTLYSAIDALRDWLLGRPPSSRVADVSAGAREATP